MFGGLGIEKILLIGVVFLLLFGAKRLPEIGSSLGKGIREFKRGTEEITDLKDSVTSSVTSAVSPDSKPVAATVAAPLPNKPEPRHEPVTLARQEID